jgi:hypothetical protein
VGCWRLDVQSRKTDWQKFPPISGTFPFPFLEYSQPRFGIWSRDGQSKIAQAAEVSRNL